MKIHSNTLKNGYFADLIGHRGGDMLKDKMPTRSFHLAWEELPAGTQSLALVFIDHDAIPVCGFSWIHWTVANIDPSVKELPENASRTQTLLEGVNSWAGNIVPDTWKLSHEEATAFGGCAPPDGPHRYDIEVYALDTRLSLQRGFYLNELQKAMEGHILDHARLSGVYRAKG